MTAYQPLVVDMTFVGPGPGVMPPSEADRLVDVLPARVDDPARISVLFEWAGRGGLSDGCADEPERNEGLECLSDGGGG